MPGNRLRLSQERARYAGALTDAALALMNRPPLVRARYATPGHYVASGGAYLFFCCCVAFTVALLTLSGFVLPQRALPSIGHEKSVGAPILVATIQLIPDRKGICRNLLFHNDTGRVDEGGFAPCRGLIPDEMLVETTLRGSRNDAIAKVFKFR
jgi:hypothetical protein